MATYTTIEQQVLDLINQYRAQKGLGAFKFNDTIQDAGRQHSQDMALGVLPFGHDKFKERATPLLAQLQGGGVAENVAKGQSAEQVFKDWINSEGHRKNIEGDYQLTGIAAEQNSVGEYLFTQIFIRVKAVATPTVTLTTPVAATSALVAEIENKLIDKIQVYRQQKGLALFQFHPSIQKAAQQHSQAMAAGSLAFGHDGFKERATALMQELKGRGAGENIAIGSHSADIIMDGWIKSEPHRKNLEADFGFSGLGAAQAADGKWYYTQVFIK